MMSRQKQVAVMRKDHPAAPVVSAFADMREKCRHYRGIKDHDESLQCTHQDASRMSNWCAMDCCPLLRERAQAESLGWT
jgi:hypothetical protein